jgi:hypothetical protein
LRAAAIGDRRDGLSPHPHPLRKWFVAAWLIGQDKRGVSALFLSRELALRYDTAWLMAHKLPRAERAAGISTRRPDRDR